MTGYLEDGFLRMEGLDDQDIADLNAALPAAAQVLAVAQTQWPKLLPHIPALLRIAQKIIAKQRSLS